MFKDTQTDLWIDTETMQDVAWLVTGDLKARPGQNTRKQNPRTFANSVPAGIKVINDTLRRAGMTTGLVKPTAPNARVILLSLTSEMAALKFLLEVQHHPAWRAPRKFKVLVGGFGMQNPQSLRHFADYAYFGRAEDEVAAIVDDLLHDRAPQSDSLVDLRDIPRRPAAVKVRQAVELFDGETYKESFIGCPLKCKFCHYTFARKHIGGDHAYNRSTGAAGQYVQMDGHGGAKSKITAEVTLPQLIDWPHDHVPTQITFGLDGCSERLRFLYGKRILDSELIAGVENYARLLQTAGHRGGFLHLYDILGMPTETADDRRQLHAALAACRPDIAALKNYHVVVRIMPFKASAWTPLAWEAFHTRFDRNQFNGRIICRFPGSTSRRSKGGGVTSNAHAIYSQFVEGPGMQISYALIARHDGSAESDRAIRFATQPKFRRAKSQRQLADFRAQFGDFASRILDRRDIDDDLPSNIADTGVPVETLRKMAAKARDDARDGRWRGKKSIMGAPVPAARTAETLCLTPRAQPVNITTPAGV